MVLLCVVVALVLLVLFVPIRYRVRGKYPEEPYGSARFTWLWHLVKVKVEYLNEKVDFGIYLCGIKLPVTDKKESQEDGDPEPSETDPQEQKASESPKEEPAKEASETSAEVKQTDSDLEKKAPEKPVNETVPKASANKKKLKKEREKASKKKGSSLKEKWVSFQGFMDDEKNKDAFSVLFGELKRLLIRIAPKRMKGHVDLCMGSPDYMGYVTIFCSLLPFMYDKRFHFNPDFLGDEFSIDADVATGGSVMMFPILISGIRIISNRNVRRMITKVRKKG